MKRILRHLLLLTVLSALLCVSAFAAGEKGIYGIDAKTGFTISANNATRTEELDVDNNAATKNESVSLDAESVSVTYQGAIAAKQYLLLVMDQELTDGVVPNVNNIQYINQDSPATAGSVTFSTVYPKSLTSGKTYYIYLSSDDGTLNSLTPAGTFKYYAAYILGDVNEDTNISAYDASCILQQRTFGKVAQKDGSQAPLTASQTMAADVNEDDNLTNIDASLILQYGVRSSQYTSYSLADFVKAISNN